MLNSWVGEFLCLEFFFCLKDWHRMKTTFSEFLLTTLKCTILFFSLLLNCLVRIWNHGFNFEGASQNHHFRVKKSWRCKLQHAPSIDCQHNWNQFVGGNTSFQPKYLTKNLCINKPGQKKWLNQPPSTSLDSQPWFKPIPSHLFESTNMLVKTCSIFSRIVHQMLGQKTHSGPIQMPSSVSFPWSNRDFFS